MKIFKIFFLTMGLGILFFSIQACEGDGSEITDPPKIIEFMGNQPMTRVGRPFEVLATVSNPTTIPYKFSVKLKLPGGVQTESETEHQVELSAYGKTTLSWTLFADKPLYGEVLLEVSKQQDILTTGVLPVRFLPEKEIENAAYIPKPNPLVKNKNLLVGAINCPLWEDNPDIWNRTSGNNGWSSILNHPERTPALGFYSQANPEVADWETKWAIEHGIDFFVYCWYRTTQGGPVQMKFESALHEALFNSQFQDQIKFAIMWTKHQPGIDGVASEDDLMNNLLPFWIENYFKRSNYLVIDNKPVLFVYTPEYLIDDLGSVENVRKAFDKMREACRNEGFDGLWLLGEYRGVYYNEVVRPDPLRRLKDLGFDYTFPYCWPIDRNPDPQRAISTQMSYITTTHELNILPQVVTISQGWSGWNDDKSIWKIPPVDYGNLLGQAVEFIENNIPNDPLGGRMLLLDNWNEWGEGHYIAPHTEYGFGYLDEIREFFSNSPSGHIDLIPEDIGMGPYDSAFREWLAAKRKK